MNENYILIVEDSHTQARQIELILRRLGYATSVAYNGMEALEQIKTRRPAIVIADILMPEMDGYQLCKTIKTDEKLKGVPVVLLTQLSDPREIIKGMECGADDFIVKPYSEELLLTRIQAILSLNQAQQAANRQAVILIVEDSPTQMEQLAYMLEEHGFTVVTAQNGKEGLEAAKKVNPTIIVSDILMPVMDGYEMAYEIKRDEALKETPIIFVTSLMERKDVTRKASVVADGYFTKPYEDGYLLSKIKSLLTLSRQEERGGELEGLEVNFVGEKYTIKSGRRQILTFLLSTYENAVQQNQDLILMQRELQLVNEQLEERVMERTLQLKASEIKYRTLLETNSDAIVVVGRSNAVYFVNKAAESLFGRSSGDLVGTVFGFPVSAGKTAEVELTRGHGSRIVAEMRVAETTWGDEKAMLATLRNITERKRIEEVLRESEENFRALAENANDGIIISAGNSGNIEFTNDRITEMTGFRAQELLKSGIKAIVEGDRLQDIIKNQRQMLDGMPYPRQFETEIRRKDGSCLSVEIAASKTLWHGKAASMVIIRDIGDRKRREEELARASKLESLGTLAGGIAHDFNNLLTGVVGNISLALAHCAPDDRMHKILKEVEKASLRAKDLTHQLLTFARGGAPIKKTILIKDLLEEAAGFALRGSNIKCEFDIEDGLSPVEVDEGQISQVIHNLVINAIQAMPQGGVIRVSARDAVTGWGGEPPLETGRFVGITVTDTGAGIPPENIPRIFDPYFTTKRDGSGLGLATVYSIIKNHGGRVTVESKIGSGSAFKILLPVSLNKISDERRPAEDAPARGSGRILVMDDEEIIRDVAGAILSELGYCVEFAVDGAQMLGMYAAARNSGAPFCAVIMDLTIPGGLGGKETIKKLLEIDPDARAIVSSGYSHDSLMSDYKKYGFKAVITKPYKVSELSAVVQGVLTGGS